MTLTMALLLCMLFGLGCLATSVIAAEIGTRLERRQELLAIRHEALCEMTRYEARRALEAAKKEGTE